MVLGRKLGNASQLDTAQACQLSLELSSRQDTKLPFQLELEFLSQLERRVVD